MSEPKIPTKLVPPGVKDDRQEAFVKTLDTMLGGFNLQPLIMSDMATIDARFLPVMVVEYSCQEFIEPGLEDEIVRGLLASSYELHAKKGTIAGTRMGLSLLGMRVDWQQWYLSEPKGLHDTHTVTAFVNLKIFRDEPGFLSEKVQRQALRMINQTKRWSQEVNFQLGAGWSSKIGTADAATTLGISRKTIDAGIDTAKQNEIAAANATSSLQIARRTIDALPDMRKRNTASAANAVCGLQVLRQSFNDAA